MERLCIVCVVGYRGRDWVVGHLVRKERRLAEAREAPAGRGRQD